MVQEFEVVQMMGRRRSQTLPGTAAELLGCFACVRHHSSDPLNKPVKKRVSPLVLSNQNVITPERWQGDQSYSHSIMTQLASTLYLQDLRDADRQRDGTTRQGSEVVRTQKHGTE